MKILTTFLLSIAVLAVSEVNGADKKAANFSGKWLATAAIPDSDSRDSTVTISKKDGKLQALGIGDNGQEMNFNRVTTKGKALTFELDFDQNGQKGVLGVKAELNKEGGLAGNWYINGEDGTEFIKSDWKAVRSAASVLGGTWDVVAVTPDTNLEHAMVIKKSGSGFSGHAESDEGQLEYTKVSASKNVVKIELPYGEGTVKIEAKLKQARKLVGNWKFYDDFGDEAATGEWSATKQKRAKKK